MIDVEQRPLEFTKARALFSGPQQARLNKTMDRADAESNA